MTKFKELKEMIIRSLEDTVDENASPLGGTSYDGLVLKDAVRAALNAIASRYWKRGVLDITAGVETADIPATLIDIDAVYEKKLALFLPKVNFQVGNALTSTAGNGFFLYPANSVTFINQIGTSGAKIYYQAHWTMPVNDSDVLEIPDLALTALIYYAGAYLLGTSAVSSASIRQFNTKVDSGQPGDIPQMKMSNFLMVKYEEELKRIPLMEKGRVQ